MTFGAQYGSSYAAYGNIQYGRFALPIQAYGAWPEERPEQAGMLYGDWQDYPAPVAPAPAIAENIAIIKRLRAELEATQDSFHRAEIRRQIEAARADKDLAFKLAARIDEEETMFMLLH